MISQKLHIANRKVVVFPREVMMNISEFPTLGIPFAKVKVLNAIGSPCEVGVYANTMVVEEGGHMVAISAGHMVCVSCNYDARRRLYQISFELDADTSHTVLEKRYVTENKTDAYQLYAALMKILK